MDLQAFNWLDLILIVMMGIAAVRGFRRGFFVEIGSLVALWLGVFAAIHFSGTMAGWLGLGEDREIIAFLITFVTVLLFVHLVARALTTVIEIAMLGWANKLAGVLIAVLRSAFVLSIALNILGAYTDGALPPRSVRDGSVLHDPVRSLAPMILPGLGETKWLRSLIEQIELELPGAIDPPTNE